MSVPAASDIEPSERTRWEDEMARECLPFARSIALRYRDRGADLDDLIGVANCALARAIRNFHPERGTFHAYAAATIHGEVKKYFRDQCWVVRPTRRVQELQALITGELNTDPQHPPSVAELAARLDVEPRDVREAMTLRGAFTPASLDRVTDGRPLHELVGVAQAEYDLIDDVTSVADAVERLPASDRELIRLRFGEEMTQTEISRQVGVSQMEVSRRLRSALDQLHAAVTTEPTAA